MQTSYPNILSLRSSIRTRYSLKRSSLNLRLENCTKYCPASLFLARTPEDHLLCTHARSTKLLLLTNINYKLTITTSRRHIIFVRVLKPRSKSPNNLISFAIQKTISILLPVGHIWVKKLKSWFIYVLLVRIYKLWSNKEERDGQGMWHIWGKSVYTRF
jgi:hypothetical protein